MTTGGQETEIRGAVELPGEGLREDGLTIPPPTSIVDYSEVTV